MSKINLKGKVTGEKAFIGDKYYLNNKIMGKKENVTKAKKTAVQAAQELLQAEQKKKVDACVAELQAHQVIENQILEKHGCVKNIQGQFLNGQIQTGFTVSIKP